MFRELKSLSWKTKIVAAVVLVALTAGIIFGIQWAVEQSNKQTYELFDQGNTEFGMDQACGENPKISGHEYMYFASYEYEPMKLVPLHIVDGEYLTFDKGTMISWEPVVAAFQTTLYHTDRGAKVYKGDSVLIGGVPYLLIGGSCDFSQPIN